MAAKRALLTAAWCAIAATAHAGPEIEIRAHTQLAFEGVRRGYDGGITAVGALRDKLTGDPIPNQRVIVTVDGQTYDGYTDDSGKFTIALPAMTGKHDVGLSFGGGSALDPADLSVSGVEVDKQPVELSITTLPLSSQGVSVQLTATSNGNAVQIKATMFAGAADADPSSLPAVGDISPGQTKNLTRKDVGGAGRRRLRAVFPGDTVYAAAQAETTFELKGATKTTLTVGAKQVAFEDSVTGTGKVTDEEGTPVPRAPVSILSNDRLLEQTSTRADGSYSFRVEGRVLGQGPHDLQAVVDITSPYLMPGHSPVVVIQVAAPQPVPVAVTAAAFLITALVAGGFFLLRSKPWDKRKRQPVPAERAAQTDDKGEVKGGLTQAKPGLVSTLRRASDLGVSGTVRDAVRGRAVPGATVRLQLGVAGQPAIAGRPGADAGSPGHRSGGSGSAVAEHSVVAGDDGGFAIENLMPGEWRAKVSASGHVSERFTLTLPHRGELRGVRVDLVPVREQVFSMYRVAAQPQLPEARLWGVWSPRQIVDHVRRQRPSPALSELTDFVEEAYFSARVPDEDVLPAAHEHVERAVRERARP